MGWPARAAREPDHSWPSIKMDRPNSPTSIYKREGKNPNPHFTLSPLSLLEIRMAERKTSGGQGGVPARLWARTAADDGGPCFVAWRASAAAPTAAACSMRPHGTGSGRGGAPRACPHGGARSGGGGAGGTHVLARPRAATTAYRAGVARPRGGQRGRARFSPVARPSGGGSLQGW